MKTCTVCTQEKPLDAFSKQAKGRFGVTSICKACTSERGKRWHMENRERSLAAKRVYAEANRDAAAARARAWRESNAEKARMQAARWTAENPDKKRASTAKRRAVRLQAVPAWACMADVRRFYVLAEKLTRDTGITANVDHIVPIQSPLVCGLHCAANLTIATEFHNKQKGNLWWPHMWGRDEELDMQLSEYERLAA